MNKKLLICVSFGALFVPQILCAQSMGSFNTVPIDAPQSIPVFTVPVAHNADNIIFVPDKEIKTHIPVAKNLTKDKSVTEHVKNVAPSKNSVKNPVKKPIINPEPKLSTKANNQKTITAEVPLPVIMFCGTPAESDNSANSIKPAIAIGNDNKDSNHIAPLLVQSVPSQAVQIAPTNAPINASVNNATKTFKEDWEKLNQRPETREEYANRGPIKAIYQDTKQAIAKDVPQAVADHLPWVDTNRKQENFDTVLGRVADNLSRASAADPEWAYAAQSEIRELAQKLDKLPQPPQYRDETIYRDYNPKVESINVQNEYNKRPIWPGAKSTSPEPSSKPNVLTN